MQQHGVNLEMAVLNRISRILVHQRNVPILLDEVLTALHREMGLQRGTITLKRNDILFIEASHGLSDVEISRGKYHMGEGITGRVAATAKGLIIPDIACEPGFLDRTQARANEQGIAFICVPVIHNEEVIGTMSIDRKVEPDTDLQRDYDLLETVANLLAEAVSSCLTERDEHERLIAENYLLKQELGCNPRPDDMIGNCSAMKAIYAMIAQVADSNATVLIRGSSGTGKELVARAIQRASGRREKPFIVVNCAALPENLVESELFGHEKGAFTGAVARRIGRVEAADSGTLFLDEIGDLSLPMQVKLLRFLQERTFQRIGCNTELKSDVRILAATSRNLEDLIAEGKFREDLYYRLNVFPILLPSLAARRGDIMLLAEHFLEKYNRAHHKNVNRIAADATDRLLSYHWPGNVRELENCMERAVLTATDGVIRGGNLPPSLQSAAPAPTADEAEECDFATRVSDFERELLEQALKKSRGNVASTARMLHLTPRILHYKLDKLHLSPASYKKQERA